MAGGLFGFVPSPAFIGAAVLGGAPIALGLYLWLAVGVITRSARSAGLFAFVSGLPVLVLLTMILDEHLSGPLLLGMIGLAVAVPIEMAARRPNSPLSLWRSGAPAAIVMLLAVFWIAAEASKAI